MPRTLTLAGTLTFDDALPDQMSHLKIEPVESANALESPAERRTLWMIAAQASDRRAYEKLLGNSIARPVARSMRWSRGRRDRRELHDELVLDRYPGSADASVAIEREQRAQRLRAAVARLPPGQREAIEHLGLRERSLRETAALAGRRTGALKVTCIAH